MDVTELLNECDAGLKDAIVAIQQPRTDFQLRHFVVGQHDTEPRRWLQCVLELQIKLQSLKRATIEQRITNRKIEELRRAATADALDRAELLQIDLEAHALAIVGAVRELQALLSIFRSFNRVYTNDELNAAEEEYWQRRLSRQARHALIATGRVGVGDLDSLQQIGSPVTVAMVKKLEAGLCETPSAPASPGIPCCDGQRPPPGTPENRGPGRQTNLPSPRQSVKNARRAGVENA